MVKQTLCWTCSVAGRESLGQMEKLLAHPTRDMQSCQCDEILHMSPVPTGVYMCGFQWVSVLSVWLDV